MTRGQIANERPQPGEFEARVSVALDHVEREIVGAAKRPDREPEQNRSPQRRLLEKQNRHARDTDHDEHRGLEIHPFRTLQILHARVGSFRS